MRIYYENGMRGLNETYKKMKIYWIICFVVVFWFAFRVVYGCSLAYFTIYSSLFVHQCNSGTQPDHPEIFLNWLTIYKRSYVWYQGFTFVSVLLLLWEEWSIYTKNNIVIGNCFVHFCLFSRIYFYVPRIFMIQYYVP